MRYDVIMVVVVVMWELFSVMCRWLSIMLWNIIFL